MIGELLTTAFVWGQLSSLVLLSVNTNDNTWHQLDDSQLDAAICQQVSSTEELQHLTLSVEVKPQLSKFA